MSNERQPPARDASSWLTSDGDIVVFLVDPEGLAKAKHQVTPGAIARLSNPASLAIVVTLGEGGGVCLAGTPVRHVTNVHFPMQLGPLDRDDSAAIIDSIYDAKHLSHVVEPVVYVFAYLDWWKHQSLLRDLSGVEHVRFLSQTDDWPAVETTQILQEASDEKVAADDPVPGQAPTQEVPADLSVVQIAENDSVRFPLPTVDHAGPKGRASWKRTRQVVFTMVLLALLVWALVVLSNLSAHRDAAAEIDHALGMSSAATGPS